jgi:hypothetical protein
MYTYNNNNNNNNNNNIFLMKRILQKSRSMRFTIIMGKKTKKKRKEIINIYDIWKSKKTINGKT